MWISTMPHYPDQHPSHPDHSINPKDFSKSTPLIVGGDIPNNMGSLPHQSPRNLADLFEPAIDGPPSPERIRQLNDQMKRATHLNRAYGHCVASSSASSLLVTERHGWNHSMENVVLSRRSSNRSAASGSPSRDLPDGSHGLTKNIFHRRAKSSKSGRTSANSSSGSSLYSTEAPSEHSLANFKDSLMPTIFTRRKSRDEMIAQRKLQISGPFNFHHVTHTPREQVASTQRPNRRELMDELSTLRISGAVGVAVTPDESEVHSFHIPNYSIEQDGLQHQAGPRRTVKYTRSQEQLRTSAPVRPPRSPVDTIASPTLGPAPPPRMSSRQSVPRNGSPVGEFDRPLTSGGFCRPRPFSPNDTLETSHELVEDIDPLAVEDGRFSHALSTPDDAAWPLPGPIAYERPLPDVPEEDEHPVFAHRSRGSVASNVSSLRAIQSVPALRTISEPHRMSGASDTLGPFETVNANRLSQVGQLDFCGPTSPIRESWEDDIDYCYEHEADANFDYQWERPSLDSGGDRKRAPPVQVALVDDELSEVPSISLVPMSPGMLSASHHDVPALSPTSQASPVVGHEVTTPISATGVLSNFSLPRVERSNRPPHLKPTHERTDSRASSFKESHGFTLSPSLLIPGDYHHQMMLTEADRQEFASDDEFRSRFYKSNAFYEDNLAAVNASPFMQQQRSSVSTTATTSTTVSDSTGERHVSTNSTWTSLTRLTSSTSLSKMTGSWSESTSDKAASSHLADSQEDSDQEESTRPASKDKDTVPELVQFPSVPAANRPHHKSHASESVVRDEVPSMKADAAKTRRPRARTTSMSVQAPPVGQYALFPRAYVKTTGDRI